MLKDKMFRLNLTLNRNNVLMHYCLCYYFQLYCIYSFYITIVSVFIAF